MTKRKKKKVGRPKKEPTRVVRVPVKRPDFEKAEQDIYGDMADNASFVDGCHYVWSRYISE